MQPDNPLLDDYILSLVAREKPRVCFLAQAMGESDGYVTRFYASFPVTRCQPTHLSLFNRRVQDLQTCLLEHDVVHVGGGNTVNMLAT